MDDVLAQRGGFDAVVLMVQMFQDASWRDSLQLLIELRRGGLTAPVLAVCNDDSRAMLGSLDCGADDFITLPLRTGELGVRLTAALRRARTRAPTVLAHGDVRLDQSAQQVTLAGQPVALQAREFMLLAHLLEHRGRVLSRIQLQESLYAQSSEIDSNAIEVHVHNLRRKLGKDLIRTVHGQGYVIDALS